MLMRLSRNCLIHNSNLTNTRDLEKQLFNIDKRHTNSSSDTEMLLNVFATELQEQIHNQNYNLILFLMLSNLCIKFRDHMLR